MLRWTSDVAATPSRAIGSAGAQPKLYKTVSAALALTLALALALTLGLAEALATSELFGKAHLIRRVTYHLCRGHGLTRFHHLSNPYVTAVQAFPCTSSNISPARLRKPAVFIRDGVTTEWAHGLWVWGSRSAHADPPRR